MSCLLPSSHAPSSSWPPSSAAPPWTRFETGATLRPSVERATDVPPDNRDRRGTCQDTLSIDLGTWSVRLTRQVSHDVATVRRRLGTWDITAPVAHLCAETPASGRCGRRLIAAEGILAERIAGGGEGAGARAAAALSILAAPTAAVEDLHASERAEEAGVLVDHDRVTLPDASGGQREEARRPHFPGVRDEHDAAAVPYAGAMTHGAARQRCRPARGPAGALDDHTSEMWRLGGRDDRPPRFAEIEQPLEELFALLGGDGLEHRTAAHGDEEEETPACCPELGGPPMDRG